MTDMFRANTNSVDFGYMKDVNLDKTESLLDDAKAWKGGSSKERKEEQARQKEIRKRAAEKARAAGAEPGDFKKRALSFGFLLFMFAVGFFQTSVVIYDFMRGDGVTRLDLNDTAQLKNILFGGEPWLIYCVNEYSEKAKVPQILSDSSGPLWSNHGVQTGMLRCWDDMASTNRSVATRFNLKKNAPLQFFVANGNKPKIVDLVGISKPEDMEKKIKPWLEVKAEKIDKIKKWPASCTSRRTCVIVGYKQTAQKDTAMNLITPILEKHRGTKFVTVDTAFWQLKLHENLLKTRPAKEGSKENKGADVLCLAKDEAKESGGNATYSGTFLKDLSANAMSSFVQACESRTGLAEMPEAPKLSARKTKPKKVKPPTPRPPTPRPPTPPSSRPQPRPRGNVDAVGSRAGMDQRAQEEALFEAVEEDEEEEEVEEEDDDGGEEVEL